MLGVTSYGKKTKVLVFPYLKVTENFLIMMSLQMMPLSYVILKFPMLGNVSLFLLNIILLLNICIVYMMWEKTIG